MGKKEEFYAKMVDVNEDQPEPNKYVLAYSQPHGVYTICCFHPCLGWRNQEDIPISAITHYVETNLELFPFPITVSSNIESMKALGVGPAFFGLSSYD